MSLLSRILLAGLAAFSVVAHAQEYPVKPIKIVVPFGPGATTDALARTVAQELNTKWGQPVLVENIAGASGGLGAEAVAKAPPDGYTLLFTPAAVLSTNLLFFKLNYDPDAFVPISVIARTPAVVVVNARSKFNNMQDLIKEGKTSESLNYASQGVGNISHLSAELLKSMTGMKMTHVPYKGSAAAVTDLMGGHVDVMMCTDLSSSAPFIRDGRLRVLAFCEEKRSKVRPDIPVVAETVPGFMSSGGFTLSAPPGTPHTVVLKISQAISEMLKSSDFVKQRVIALNVDPVGSSPEEMAQMLAQERVRWGKVIRDNNIKAD